MTSGYNTRMPSMTLFAILLLGWAAGSLVNYLADVLPRRRRLSAPFCLSCAADLPVRNYLFWPRRCPACSRRRTQRAWLVEMGMAVAALWLWVSPPARLGFPASLALLVYFALVIVVDIEHRLILHKVSLAGALLALALGLGLHGAARTLFGGLAGFGGMFLLYLLGGVFLWVRSRGRISPAGGEALGFGDVALGGVLGLLLGLPAIWAGLILAILLAGAASLVYLAVALFSKSYRPDLAIPYGPFLVLSATLLIFFQGAVASLFG